MTEFGFDDETGLSWLEDAREHTAWYEALAALDRRNDKQPLIALLKSGEQVPASIAFHLGDLLERRAIKARQGARRTPSYMRTPQQIKLTAAVIYVHRHVHQDGVALSKALEMVAAEFELPKETLADAWAGKHGGLQRAKRNWYSPKS